MKKKNSILFAFCSFFLAMTTIISLTYSWIARVWTPKIEETDLAITTAGALVILVDDSSVSTLNLTDTFGLQDFVFKQVSSIDGDTFFSINYTPDTVAGTPIFQKVNFAITDNKTDIAKSIGYIDVRFALMAQEIAGQNFQKAVFLHTDTTFSYAGAVDSNPRHAMRISIMPEDGTQDALIFGEPDAESNYYGVYGNADGQNYVADNEQLLQAGLLGSQTVHAFTDYDGGDPNTNGDIDGTKVLLYLTPGTAKWLRVRIWLEGADELCTDAIADSHFGLTLKFDSFNVLAIEE